MSRAAAKKSPGANTLALARKAGNPSDAVRRVPTQARSKLRLERILLAADSVFAEVGYDAATTEQIAERAGSSIGSLYQFFPNKTALFEALCANYLERARELFEELLRDPAAVASLPELIDRSIDAFWRFHVDLPGFRAVWVHQNISAQMLAASDAVNQALAVRAEQVMAPLAPHVPQERRAAAAAVVVETVSAILFVAVRRQEPEAGTLVTELKRMVRAYLASVFGESSSAAG